MEVMGGVLIFLAVLMVPMSIIGMIFPKMMSPKDKPPLPRSKLLASCTVLFFVFGIAGGAMVGSSSSQPSKLADATAVGADAARTAVSDQAPPTQAPAVAHRAPMPEHNYSIQDGDLYGYQPSISDTDLKNGVATKALVMVRYRGEKRGVYVVEMPDDSGAVYRMECRDPCQYVKTKVIAGGAVLKTETVPNAEGSLMRAVFDDVLSGQLHEHGKG
jgi:hypothetical protein